MIGSARGSGRMSSSYPVLTAVQAPLPSAAKKPLPPPPPLKGEGEKDISGPPLLPGEGRGEGLHSHALTRSGSPPPTAGRGWADTGSVPRLARASPPTAPGSSPCPLPCPPPC